MAFDLAYRFHALDPFARDLGCAAPPSPRDESLAARLRAELDAFYPRAYGLARDDLAYILDPPAGCPSETFRVLKRNETARWGEYRTARLVMAAWDGLDWKGL